MSLANAKQDEVNLTSEMSRIVNCVRFSALEGASSDVVSKKEQVIIYTTVQIPERSGASNGTLTIENGDEKSVEDSTIPVWEINIPSSATLLSSPFLWRNYRKATR